MNFGLWVFHVVLSAVSAVLATGCIFADLKWIALAFAWVSGCAYGRTLKENNDDIIEIEWDE